MALANDAPSGTVPSDDDISFEVVPSSANAARPRPEAPLVPGPEGTWGVREQKIPATAFPWVSTPLPEPPKPPSRVERLSKRYRAMSPTQQRLTKAGTLGVLAGIVFGVFFTLALSGNHLPAVATTHLIYKTPLSLAGVTRATALSPEVRQVQQSFQSRGLEKLVQGAAYVDAGGKTDYGLVVFQDNAGRNVLRGNAYLPDAFPDVDSSTQMSQSADGFTVTCGTVVAAGSAFQACTWYNQFAIGAFTDHVAPSPAVSATTLLTTLQTMVVAAQEGNPTPTPVPTVAPTPVPTVAPTPTPVVVPNPTQDPGSLLVH